MDGFDIVLKKGLKQSTGDLTISARDSFFHLDSNITNAFKDLGITHYTPIIQKEAFLVFDGSSKGVLVKGIDQNSSEKGGNSGSEGSDSDNVIGVNYKLSNKEALVGQELFKILNLKVGDNIVLVFASADESQNLGPSLNTFTIKGFVKHDLYIKDLRFVYVNKSVLQHIFNLSDDQVNIISVNIPLTVNAKTLKYQDQISLTKHMSLVSDYQQRLQLLLNETYDVNKNSTMLRVYPFWREFQYLIEAVKVEKLVISIILQLIVIISIFNVMAFILYLNEKQAQEISLLQALGMSKKKLIKIWLTLVLIIWLISSFVAIILTRIFDFALKNLPFLKNIPGEIYNLTRLSLEISIRDYCIVFFLTLFWILLIALMGFRKIKKDSTLKGLRKGFS
ncbi:MAG: ABC transporter permease [Oligoflexia bacterium]|nr:ABC transporter permease [Oligoflexia bacterium]